MKIHKKIKKIENQEEIFADITFSTGAVDKAS